MLQKKVQAQLGAPLAVAAVTHTHTRIHSLTHTHSIVCTRSLSLSVALSRSVCCWGQRVFKQVSQVCAALLLLLFPSSSLCAAVGRDQPPILFTHLLELPLPLSLLAARCSAAQRRRRFLFAGVYVDFIAGVARFIVLICVRLLPLSLALFRCLPLSIYFSIFLWLSL